MSRRLAALAVVALAGAGCGSHAAAKTATATATPASAQDKLVKLAECIRAHGVPHFPDPDAKGEFDFGIDVSPAVWKRAVDACKALEPPGAFSGKRSPKQQSDALRFAECVRAHGVGTRAGECRVSARVRSRLIRQRAARLSPTRAGSALASRAGARFRSAS